MYKFILNAFFIIGLGFLNSCGGESSGNSSEFSEHERITVRLSLITNRTSVLEGDSIELQWFSDAANCVASGDWGGQIGGNGSQMVGPLFEDSEFSLQCGESPGALETLDSVSISVEENTYIEPTINTVVSNSGLSSLNFDRYLFDIKKLEYNQNNETLVFLTTPESQQLPNSIVVFNPQTGEVTASLEFLAQPYLLSLSDDGAYFYVAVQDEGIHRIESSSLTTEAIIGPSAMLNAQWLYISAIDVSPIENTTIVVASDLMYDVAVIFDRETPRPVSFGKLDDDIVQLTWDTDGSRIFTSGHGINTSYILDVSDEGLTEVAQHLWTAGPKSGSLFGNVYYSDFGGVYRVDTDTDIIQTGRLPFPSGGAGGYSFSVALDHNKVFMMDSSDFGGFRNGSIIYAVDPNTNTIVDSIAFVGIADVRGFNLVSWGENGLAFADFESGELIISSGSFARSEVELRQTSKFDVLASGAMLVEGSELSYTLYNTAANDISSNSCDELFMSMWEHSDIHPNNIVKFDHGTGEILANIYSNGSDPSFILASEDCTTLYAGHDASWQISRINTTSMSIDAVIDLDKARGRSIAISPSDVNTIAVAKNDAGKGALCDGGNEGVAIYDGEIRRPGALTDSYINGLAWGDTENDLFGIGIHSIYSLRVDSLGISSQAAIRDIHSDGTLYRYDRDLSFDSVTNRLYSFSENAIDVSGLHEDVALDRPIARLSNSCGPLEARMSDNEGGKIYFSGYNEQRGLVIWTYDKTSFDIVDTIEIPNYALPNWGPFPRRIVRVSSDKIAVLLESGNTLIVDSDIFAR